MRASLHIGVEATRLLRDRRGIGRYVRNLLRLMPQLHDGVRYTLFVSPSDDHAALNAHLETYEAGLSARCTLMPVSRMADTEVDVVWYPWNFITRASRVAPMVPSTLDLAPMLQHDHRWWNALKRLKYKRRYQRTVSLAQVILTISDYSKRDIVSRLGVAPDKIHVALLAADDLPLHDADAGTDVLASLDLPATFFLTVGAQEARKNLRTLYAAMNTLHARGVHVPLVQCGPGMSKQTRAMIGDTPWLRHIGYVSDDQLVALYRRATALVFPSRYEGFGLPVAEAMIAGGRVICANASSLPEVAGDAALYFEWPDSDALVAQMERLLSDSALREDLTARGRAQAATFSWRRVAEESLQAFEQAVSDYAQHTARQTAQLR